MAVALMNGKLIKFLAVLATILLLSYNIFIWNEVAKADARLRNRVLVLGVTRQSSGIDSSGRELDAGSSHVSDCKCRSDQTLRVTAGDASKKLTVYLNGRLVFESVLNESGLFCQPFKALRRGPKQKVIGISLYGKDARYYESLQQISRSIKKMYPEWTIRIYHDDTINKSKICELECLREFANDTGSFVDNLDFCDVNRLPLDLFDPSRTWSAGYLHAMKWRWLPVGDSLVDYFMSRDSDSLILEREVDAVNEWIKSNTLLHVMRDHQRHFEPILGGLWGLATLRDRNFSQWMLQKILASNDKNVTTNHAKGKDQEFLRTEIWPVFVRSKNATVHASFHCKSFNFTAQSFPTRRRDFCFIGCIAVRKCCSAQVIDKCPSECRPADHRDWEYC